ncbi:hypothetical protein ABZ297_39470 [Nonomuraea sp. NPDC005983]|uniref:hypothetical protein n=1 Tax=Nonomuraea sp. NPDC005983 TaxID=3155595 RepID=UPI00339E9F15
MQQRVAAQREDRNYMTGPVARAQGDPGAGMLGVPVREHGHDLRTDELTRHRGTSAAGHPPGRERPAIASYRHTTMASRGISAGQAGRGSAFSARWPARSMASSLSWMLRPIRSPAEP